MLASTLRRRLLTTVAVPQRTGAAVSSSVDDIVIGSGTLLQEPGAVNPNTDSGLFIQRARLRLRALQGRANSGVPVPALEEADRPYIHTLIRGSLSRNRFDPFREDELRAIWVARILGYNSPAELLFALDVLPGHSSVHIRMAMRGMPEHITTRAQQLEQDYHAGLRDKILGEPDRRDFSSSTVYAIDDEKTMDPDDAFSIEDGGNGTTWLHVHIADPTAMIPLGSELDLFARHRNLTIYGPSFQDPMFPRNLAHDVFALDPRNGEQGIPSLTFSLKVNDADAKVLDRRISPSVVRKIVRLTYDGVNQMLEDGSEHADSDTTRIMRKTYDLANKLYERRLYSGAIPIIKAQPLYTLNADGAIDIKSSKTTLSKSARLIEELMLLTNYTAASYCAEMNVSIPFRVNVIVPISQAALRKFQDSARRHEISYDVINYMFQSMVRTQPCASSYSLLGLPCYTTVSSPIRRYRDVIVQQQIKAHLRGKPVMDMQTIIGLMDELDVAEKIAKGTQIAVDTYYDTMFYHRKLGEIVDAVVVRHMTPFMMVTLLDTGVDIKIAQLAPCRIGEQIRVRVQEADPNRLLLYCQMEPKGA